MKYLNFVSVNLPQEVSEWVAFIQWIMTEVMNFEVNLSKKPSPHHTDAKAELLLKRGPCAEELSIYLNARADII